MQEKELFINGESVDFLEQDEPIPYTLQVNDLGDLTSLYNNYTKQFKLPLTQRNKIILGFPDDVNVNTGLVYQENKAKLIVSGIEIIRNGKAEIQDTPNNCVDVAILAGNCDFLDKLGGQIYDMGDSTTPWSGYGQNLVWNQYSLPFPNDPNNIENCVWDVPHAAYSQKKTSGWIWPIVNYGDIDTTPPFAGHVNVRNLRPGFFLKSAIELLIQSTGYTIDKERSCLYNDPVYANLYEKGIIQFSNSDFEHGTDFQNTPDNLGATYTNGQDQVISKPRIFGLPQTNIYNNDNPYSTVLAFGPSDHYEATTNVNFTATVQFDLYVRGRLGGSQATEVIIKFTLVDANGTITDFASSPFFLDQSANVLFHNPLIAEQTFLNQKLSQDFSLVTGQKLYVRCHINNIGTDPEYDTYVIFRKSATFAIVTNEKTLLWQQPIQCERILPDISQTDLLKVTLMHFGLILISDPNTGKVIFTSLKTIVANKPIAKDWSSKLVDAGKDTNPKFNNYSQVNWLRYQDDDSIPRNYMPKFFADDSIPINDKTLNPTQPVQDLYVSPFGPSINRPYIGGTIAQISDPTSTDEFSVGNQPRLLIDQKLDISATGAGGNPLTVTFSDGDAGFETVTIPINDVISVPYFYKPDAPDLGEGVPRHLAWKDLPGSGVNIKGQQAMLPGLRSSYYKEFQHILKKPMKVNRYFTLEPVDIAEFDPRIPVYLMQDNAYFFVNKIDSWVKDTPTKVELIRL